MPEEESLTTWHFGLCARYWSEVVGIGGEDAERFETLVRSPALDVGCGTGRLLIPIAEAGVDVDGADASQDMIEYCRSNAEERGLNPSLYVQALHELDVDKRYATIYLCGTFGLGGPQFVPPGIERAFAHLIPGGQLVFDHYLPKGRDYRGWMEPPEFPRDWRPDRPKAPLPDGCEITLSTRQLAFDPLEQSRREEMRLRLYRDDELIREETYELVDSIIFKLELERMLAVAGFTDITMTDWDTGGPPEPWQSSRLLVTATRPL